MLRYITAILFLLSSTAFAIAEDRPPDDLTGVWRGQMSCSSGGGQYRNYQEAELTFAPANGGWSGKFKFRKRDSKDSFSSIQFNVLIHDSDRSKWTKITSSDIRWIENPHSFSLEDVKMNRYSESGVHYVELRPDGLDLKCFSYNPMRYVKGSAEEILAAPGKVATVREIPASLRSKLAACSKISSPGELGRCVVAAENARTSDRSVDFFSTKYIDSVAYRARSNLRSASCSTDIANLAEFRDDLTKFGFDGRYEPANCEDVALVFRSITGVEENYRLCADITTYSREGFIACLNKIWSIKGSQKAAGLYRKLTGSNEADISLGISMAQLWDAGFNPTSYVNNVRSPLLENIRACNSGRALARQSSPLSQAFSEALTFGYTDDNPSRPNSRELHDSVTCSDMAHFLIANDLVGEDEVKALLDADGTLDLCGSNRPNSAPTLQEVQSSSGALALRQMCSRDMFQFAVSVVGMDANFVVSNDICKMDVYGLPIVSLGYRFRPSTCVNTGNNKSECQGPVEVFCSAADKSREILDCAGKNVAYDAKFAYTYDANVCKWTADNLNIDLKSARLIEGLR